MATAHVADLVTTMRADTAKFDKDVENTKKRLRGYTSEAKKSTKQNSSLSDSFKHASGQAAQLPGPLGSISGQVDGMIGTVTSLGFAWTAAGTAVAAAIGAFAAGLPTLAETERRMLQQEQLIKATGYSSGYTATQLDELARSVAMSTLTSTQEASKAIGVMLTFRSVMNDQNNTFERAIYIAQDMASVMGGDITSAAKQLGKALEMPSTGMTALRESGVSFSQAQIDMVKAMEESGRVAEAQAFILDELDNQIGGAAGAEAGGLIGTVDTFGQRVEEAFEAFGTWTEMKPVVQDVISEINEGLKVVKDFFAPTTTDEALDLMSERVKIMHEMNKATKEAGGQQNLGSYFGYTKSDWFNDQRRLTEIDARLKELSDARDKRLKEEKEAQDKAEQAAAERQKQRDAEKAAREKKLADEKAERESQRRKAKEDAEKEADEKERDRKQAQTDSWLDQLNRRILSEQDALKAARMDEVDRLNEAYEEKLISAEEHEEGMNAIRQHYSEQRQEIIKKELEEQEEAQKGFWDRYYESMQESAYNTDELWRQTFDNFTTGFGNAFASAIMDSQNAGDAFKNMAKGMAQSMLAALGKIMAQRLVMWALEKTLMKGEAAGEVARVASEGSSASILSGIHAYSSTAAIPIVGPALAPAAATAAVAATAPMVGSAVAAASAGFAGAFDNGGYIQAGQWGVTGEYGPEITLGPSHIMGRKQTMSMLQDARQGDSNSGPASVVVNLIEDASRAGTVEQSNDGDMVTLDVRVAKLLQSSSSQTAQVMQTRYRTQQYGS
ncbi:phage tail length tape measure family protein [Vibrio parahaemolyticus]|uniref:phage tail length tape measure family protein n=1 Tax=Vibrio parahaemolyticus TaxID=670 RepID=UPI00215C3F22|nr:phage tail length tape measure family protein [Vibrio parahaemolyticus]MCR9778350.1 phage tail length tape measure family protein [Vibrio parahaemolyticus]MCR9843694.1 phage tail length tape measure family protein [Vibrio parahaemolyticus]